MHHADGLYPDWRFEENVGYSTPEHRDAIAATASLRYTACPSSRSPTSSWPSERRSERSQHGAVEVLEREQLARRRRAGPHGVEAQPRGGGRPAAGVRGSHASASRRSVAAAWRGPGQLGGFRRAAGRRLGAASGRVLTSAKTSVSPSQAIRSISPWRVRSLRASIRSRGDARWIARRAASPRRPSCSGAARRGGAGRLAWSHMVARATRDGPSRAADGRRAGAGAQSAVVDVPREDGCREQARRAVALIDRRLGLGRRSRHPGGPEGLRALRRARRRARSPP